MSGRGKLRVKTENILPVIKKWLYSDRDIFIRELVSNACDAISKRRTVSGDTETDFRIDITIHAAEKTIAVSDNGVGMTEEEVKKYISQIAYSGAEKFFEKYGGEVKGSGIIGHFGLGFYSAFMVSDIVEIHTLSCQEKAEPVCWRCDGGPEYSVKAGTRAEPGTTIILHIAEDSREFLKASLLRELLEKYCSFMPYPIYLHGEKEKGGRPVNNVNPLWNRFPKDCSEEEYRTFYRETFHDSNEPLFWIHLNVSHPFVLKGILYFPKQSEPYGQHQGKISLYSNQVFVADNIKEVIPEFLFLLRGIIDCPDMPLNVSRSFLQNDGTVQKISDHIVKKVADRLTGMYRTETEKFNGCWEDIAPFIKYGCLRDDRFYTKVKDILTVKTISGKYLTLEEYGKKNQIIYYVTDEKVQAQYIMLFKQFNREAVFLDHEIDKHFLGFLEYKQKTYRFKRIDTELPEEMQEPELQDYSKLTEQFKKAIDSQQIQVKTARLKDTNLPALMIISEEAQRLQRMQTINHPLSGVTGSAPQECIILNTGSALIKQIPYLKKRDRGLVCQLIYDLVKMNNRQLSPEEVQDFTERSIASLSALTEHIRCEVEVSDVEIIL